MKPLRFFVLLCLVFASSIITSAQSAISVKCGDIIEDEFTIPREEKVYSIMMAPGDMIDITSSRIGDQLKINLVVRDPVGNVVSFGGEDRGSDVRVTDNPATSTGVLSGRGDYLLLVANHARSKLGELWSDDASYRGGIGVFTLYVGCTLRDGTKIAPGDAQPAGGGGDGGLSGEATNIVTPPFSGTGFPGLPAKDFADGITIPFQMDIPNSGAINPGFDSVFGFTLDMNAGDKLDLTFTRLSGNLNLGLAVLSADNKIIYQASLVNAEKMSALFTLPAAGQYTIGVFKIDLLPPDTPENTAFQLTGKLNPA